jgi:large-conductance mechanosensitive channel
MEILKENGASKKIEEANIIKEDSFLSNNSKLITGYCLGALTFVTCIILSYFSGSHSDIKILACLLGGVFGWLVGIILSPLNDAERKDFSTATATIGTFVSGLIVGKIDLGVVSAIYIKFATDFDLLFSFVVFSICMFVGILYTFVTRKYSRSDAEIQKKRDELMEKQDKILKELRNL